MEAFLIKKLEMFHIFLLPLLGYEWVGGGCDWQVKHFFVVYTYPRWPMFSTRGCFGRYAHSCTAQD